MQQIASLRKDNENVSSETSGQGNLKAESWLVNTGDFVRVQLSIKNVMYFKGPPKR
jgi:hypothetical protein